MKPKTMKLTATNARNGLTALMVVLILGVSAGFYFGSQAIKDYALEVTHAVADASASSKNIDDLGALKKKLAESQSLVTKASALFATQNNYQTQSLKDIQKYANENDITVTNTEFDKDATGLATTATAGGHLILVTVKSPISYEKFIRFLDAIEGNLPKMQVSGINISRPANSSDDQITTDKITITVATR